MVVKIKTGDSPEKINKMLHAVEEALTKKRVEQLQPFFGAIKRSINPLTLQKKWRDEWK